MELDWNSTMTCWKRIWLNYSVDSVGWNSISGSFRHRFDCSTCSLARVALCPASPEKSCTSSLVVALYLSDRCCLAFHWVALMQAFATGMPFPLTSTSWGSLWMTRFALCLTGILSIISSQAAQVLAMLLTPSSDSLTISRRLRWWSSAWKQSVPLTWSFARTFGPKSWHPSTCCCAEFGSWLSISTNLTMIRIDWFYS